MTMKMNSVLFLIYNLSFLMILCSSSSHACRTSYQCVPFLGIGGGEQSNNDDPNDNGGITANLLNDSSNFLRYQCWQLYPPICRFHWILQGHQRETFTLWMMTTKEGFDNDEPPVMVGRGITRKNGDVSISGSYNQLVRDIHGNTTGETTLRDAILHRTPNQSGTGRLTFVAISHGPFQEGLTPMNAQIQSFSSYCLNVNIGNNSTYPLTPDENIERYLEQYNDGLFDPDLARGYYPCYHHSIVSVQFENGVPTKSQYIPHFETHNGPTYDAWYWNKHLNSRAHVEAYPMHPSLCVCRVSIDIRDLPTKTGNRYRILYGDPNDTNYTMNWMLLRGKVGQRKLPQFLANLKLDATTGSLAVHDIVLNGCTLCGNEPNVNNKLMVYLEDSHVVYRSLSFHPEDFDTSCALVVRDE